MNKYVFFWGGEFSQWYPSKFKVWDVEYSTAEQYMMAQKALLFKDYETHEKIMAESNPKIQQELGRQVKNFDKQKWEAACKQIVYEGNYAKFTQNPDLLKLLKSTTGCELVEASPSDKIWGVGLAETDPRIQDKSQWLGTNWLGEILTRLREDILIGKFFF